jgi:hypothetical protein
MQTKLAYPLLGVSVTVLIGVAFAQQQQAQSQSKSTTPSDEGVPYVKTQEDFLKRKALYEKIHDDNGEFEKWSKLSREEVNRESAKRLKIIYKILMRKAVEDGVARPSIYWLSGSDIINLKYRFTKDEEMYAWFSPVIPYIMRNQSTIGYMVYVPSTREANDGGDFIPGYRSRLETLEKEPNNYPLLVDFSLDLVFGKKGEHQRAMILFSNGSVREVESVNGSKGWSKEMIERVNSEYRKRKEAKSKTGGSR